MLHLFLNPVEDEDFSLEMNFGNFTFSNETEAGDFQCANITILDDEIFEKFQVILLTIGESEPPGIERDEFLKIKILDDGKCHGLSEKIVMPWIQISVHLNYITLSFGVYV